MTDPFKMLINEKDTYRNVTWQKKKLFHPTLTHHRGSASTDAKLLSFFHSFVLCSAIMKHTVGKEQIRYSAAVSFTDFK